MYIIYRWYRVSDSAALYPIPLSQRIILSRTLLLIKNADERDTGKWVCGLTVTINSDPTLKHDFFRR